MFSMHVLWFIYFYDSFNSKRVIHHLSVKLFYVSKGILPLLKDVDAIIVGFVCNEFALHKIRHIRVNLVTANFIRNDYMVNKSCVLLEPLSCTVDGTKLFRQLLLNDNINLVNWGDWRAIIGTMRIFQEFLVRYPHQCNN
jgi:hypothetical protein